MDKKNDSAKRHLSAMEHTVLGIAWKRGPCTTYGLMKELSSSTSTYYKERAGTVYPLVNRLLKLGYLRIADSGGLKDQKLIEITDLGFQSLQSWISEPISEEDVAHTVDFIRLRVFYLASVDPGERNFMIETSLAMLERQLDECKLARRRYVDQGDDFSNLATLGTVFETIARIDWLKAIHEQVCRLPEGIPRVTRKRRDRNE